MIIRRRRARGTHYSTPRPLLLLPSSAVVAVVACVSVQGQTTGFTLDSLLKLNTAKAFDKKTSILHYLVILAKRNDPTLLDFKDVRDTQRERKLEFEPWKHRLYLLRGRHGALGTVYRPPCGGVSCGTVQGERLVT